MANGLSAGLRVIAVAEESPAAVAGLGPDDLLFAGDGSAAESTASASQASAVDQTLTEEALEEALQEGSVQLRVERAGAARTVRIDAVLGCPIRARLAHSQQRNAFADGRTVIITTALFALIRSDDELAVAIGHELAHNLLGHPPQGALSRAATRVNEDTADRLGLRLAWAAGYDPTAALSYWRRVDRGLRLGPSSHPSVDARARMLNEVVAELAAAAPQSKVRSDQSSGKARLPIVD